MLSPQVLSCQFTVTSITLASLIDTCGQLFIISQTTTQDPSKDFLERPPRATRARQTQRLPSLRKTSCLSSVQNSQSKPL